MHHFGIRIRGKNFPLVCSDVHSSKIKHGIELAEQKLGFKFSELYNWIDPTGINTIMLHRLNEAYNIIDPIVDLAEDYTTSASEAMVSYLLCFEYWVDILRHYVAVGLGYTVELYTVGLNINPSIDL
ncbi:hypothetical protein IACHDJAJ_00025 [Aeromonas phage vB_AdhS_TS3]|nr:hypothetical protein IACHDJAJ_00025 [Aeromonas phage vB_AdhS_TS3]